MNEQPDCSKCKAPMTKKVVRKEGANKGREFWTCPREGCDGFKWVNDEKKEEKTEKKVPQEVWERKDRWQAKESAWKSASSVFRGTGEILKTAKLAKVIYKSITDEEWKIKISNGMAKKEPDTSDPSEQELEEMGLDKED